MQSLQLLLQASVRCELPQSLGCCAPRAAGLRSVLQSSMQGAEQRAWLLHEAPEDVICTHRSDGGAMYILSMHIRQYDVQCSAGLNHPLLASLGLYERRCL